MSQKGGNYPVRRIWQSIIIGIFIAYCIWLIHPLFQNALSGVFVSPQEPKEYKELDAFLFAQPEFFRTLWIPSVQRFGLYSINHPTVGLYDVLPKLKKVSDLEKNKILLQEIGVRYVIVPYDSVGEIFLTDRKYDDRQYNKTLAEVRKISWLTEYKHFGKLVIFQVEGSHSLFTLLGVGKITYVKKNPTEYVLHFSDISATKLVFATAFDPHWQLRYSKYVISSLPYNNLLNSFSLPKGTHDAELTYTPQIWVNRGILVSILTAIMLFVLYLIFK